ncbi:MAG: AMP-binding protein [Pseudomonadota bacterium]
MTSSDGASKHDFPAASGDAGGGLSVFASNGPPPCPPRFNIAAHVLSAAATTPQKIALQVLADAHGAVAETWRFADLDRRIRGLAAGLGRAGLKPGDRVALRFANSADFPLVFFATIAAGGVAVPVAAQLIRGEAAAILHRVAPRFAAFGPGLDAPLPPGTAALGPTTLAEMATEAPGPVADTAADDPAFLIFTSGTSGSPRGVLHAQRSAWARRMMWQGWYGLSEADRVLHAGAFNWTYTLGAGLTDPWAAGATALVYAGPPDPLIWPRLAAHHHPTIFAAVPGVYRQMLRAEDDLAAAFAPLRHGLTAGEKMPSSVADAWSARTAKPIHEALGMTELSTFISGAPDRPAPPGAIGYPQPGRRVAILAEDAAPGQRHPVPRGTPGLLAAHRADPGLMIGYWQDPAADAATSEGDWFVPGDRGVMAADGAITHLGRADDVMNALGYRVAPQEVEQALAGAPGIAEIAVAELPMRTDLSLIAAFVVPAADWDGTAVLEAWAADRLAPYKCPRLWIEVDALPRTANGKLRRRALVAEHRRDTTA